MLFTVPVLLALGSSTAAHMMMANPVPFGKSTLNNSPLLADGSDFPCKQRAGVYDAQGAANVYPAGSEQTISAVHGGGSCQLSVTTDAEPTKDSDWRVIHSIIGGCPTRTQAGNFGDGTNNADTYKFTIPAELAGGTYTLAWTWFNRIGNREMYMNCAPMTVTPANSKLRNRSPELTKRDVTAFLSTLPKMFVANLRGVNTCGTAEVFSVQFPFPGTSVEKNTGNGGIQDPTLVNEQGQIIPGGVCPSNIFAPAPYGGSSSANAPAQSSAVPAAPSNSGGVFATTSISATATIPTTMATTLSTSSIGVFVPGSTSVVSTLSTSATESASSPPAAPSNAAGVSQAAAFPVGTACSPEGMFNCLAGGTSFQQCGSGIWQSVMPMAAMTSCKAGLSMDPFARKARRSHQHRHLHRASRFS